MEQPLGPSEPIKPDLSERHGRFSRWTQPGSFKPWHIVPFFLSGLLFSMVFPAVFAPFLILMVRILKGPRLALLALLSNALVVGFLTANQHQGMGSLGFLLYFATVGILLWGVPASLNNKALSLESGVLLNFMLLFGLLIGSASVWSMLSRVDLFTTYQNTVQAMVDQVAKVTQEQGQVIDKTQAQMVKEVVRETPSAIAILCLITVFTNFVLLMRMNPAEVRVKRGIPFDYFQFWKTPEWLVWPALIAAAGYIAGEDLWIKGFSEQGSLGFVVSLNLFNFFVALYAIQGASIGAYLLRKLGVQRGMRSMILIFFVLFVWPLFAGLGFFDLWFDIRAKFRQT